MSLESDRLRVTQAWDDLSVVVGEVLGQIRVSVAGAPCIDLHTTAVEARDDDGPIPLTVQTASVDGTPVQSWNVERATKGAVVLTYLAEPTTEWPSSPKPPLELRHEGDGFSAALKCLLVLPPGTGDATFDLTLQPSLRTGTEHDAATGVSSLSATAHTHEGAELEVLSHTYIMCSTHPLGRHTSGDVSTWWLTPPSFDVPTFTRQLGDTYQAMAATFDAEAHAFKVFVRATPHRGMSASAHPASFVIAMDPHAPVDARTLQRTVTHELVHEWLHLDGPADETTWFNEGAADYYALTIARRRRVIEDEAFVAEVNTAARLGYANPFHDLALHEASQHYWSDFRAHRLPYARGMFYLADLDARLRADTDHTLDTLIRDMLSEQRAGRRVGLSQWCALVDRHLGSDERAHVQRMVFDPGGYPRAGTFGPLLSLTMTEVPIIEPGFHVDTFPTRHVQHLAPGSPADQAGLIEGEPVQLPTYEQVANLNSGEHLSVTVDRNGTPTAIAVPLGVMPSQVVQPGDG